MERIPVTHAGSLIRPAELLSFLSAIDQGKAFDSANYRAALSRARGPLFLSESRRNLAEPLTLWTWSKVVRRVALVAEVPRCRPSPW